MAAPALPPLSDLPRGHQFSPISFSLSAEDVSRYLAAVEDATPIYADLQLAPPLAVAARALGSLLEQVGLAGGTLHTGQEMEARAAVPFGAALTLTGRIAQRSERAGMIISVLEFEVTLVGSDTVAVAGRTTVMVPAGAASSGAAS